MTLSNMLDSPINPTSLTFLKAKKAALNTNFGLVKDRLSSTRPFSPSELEVLDSVQASSIGESTLEIQPV